MKVVRLCIANFRGVKEAELHFDGHTLLIGSNNVGKSTICEALDLALGPDRLNRAAPIDEFDFYNAQYLQPAEHKQPPQGPEAETSDADQASQAIGTGAAGRVSIELRIEVVLVELSDGVVNRCGGHTEFWQVAERRLLAEGEVELAAPPTSVPCLRLVTIGRYDPEEDEFEAATYFSHSPDEEGIELRQVPRGIKREFGFLYLRALRTGSRALSLERGSLLDIILRTKGIRTTLWEKTIDKLREHDVEQDATEIAPVLREIEQRLSRYIALESPGNATKLHVSELTRDSLRRTMAFFLSLSSDQTPVPFAHAGTGTLNTLVLALLSFIADLKPESVIFAMEEPEIAVPPPTQRRITQYLLTKTAQSFVTSHSPFVIERYEPAQILLLSRDCGSLTSQKVSDASGLTEREFKQFSRAGLCECMLGRAVIVLEGLTEFHALPVAAARLEMAEQSVTGGHSLDILGATFFRVDGDGNIAKFGKFFKTLGLKTFAFYDHNPRRKDKSREAIQAVYDINCEHPKTGIEELVAAEMPTSTLWAFLDYLRNEPDGDMLGIPPEVPDDTRIRELTVKVLESKKGAGWIAELFELCDYEELPATLMNFLREVFAALPKPAEVGPNESAASVSDGNAATA